MDLPLSGASAQQWEVLCGRPEWSNRSLEPQRDLPLDKYVYNVLQKSQPVILGGQEVSFANAHRLSVS